MEPSSLEESSSCLDTILDSQPWVTLLEQGLHQVTSRAASPQPGALWAPPEEHGAFCSPQVPLWGWKEVMR